MTERRTFAREYRPTTLEGYVGNDSVKKTVRGALSRGAFPQVILVQGFTGCGKTTVSRILMREYECTGRVSKDQDACGVCESCVAFTEYIRTGDLEDLPDVTEINVAETSGKSDVVDLLEGRIYPPMYGKYKYYYFDEVHKASDALQNYLLKPIEEPEEHVVYILATTDVDKLLPTIRNRAQMTLNIRKPTEYELVKHLGTICLSEDIAFEEEGLRMIASRADYVIRESLNYLQQVVDSHGTVTADVVAEEFDFVTDSLLFEFYHAYIQRDYMRYMTILHEIKTKMTFESFLLALRNFTIRGIYILNGVPLEGMNSQELKQYTRLFSVFDVMQLSLLLSRLLKLGEGNIEANLLDFMYRQNLEDNFAASNNNDLGKGTSVEVSVKEELRERNTNIEQAKEKAELAGQLALSSEIEPTRLLDALDGFTVQRVEASIDEI